MALVLTAGHARAAWYALATVAALAVGTGVTYEAHRTRVATEALRDAVVRPPAPAPGAPQAARCTKDVSHLDHDVELGVPGPCPDPADGVCLTVQGHPLPISVVDARCRAGKL